MSQVSSSNHLCQITLLGNLVTKPDIRYQANPVVAVAEIKLATHSRWLDKTTNKYREWTSFHTVKVIGDIVDKALIHADKGDVILVHGYLLNSKKSSREIIHATFAQTFAKGYAQSLNQIQCSGQISSEIQLVTTEQNKELAEFKLAISHQVHSPITQNIHSFTIERPVHVWGKQAHYIKDHAHIGDPLVIDGKINYFQDAEKSQFIEARQVVLLKNQ